MLETRAVLTTFGLGDVVFTGYQSTTNDKVSVVLLKDISGTSVLTVTDNAWSGTALATNEGTSAITFTGAFPAGSQFNYDASRTAGQRWALGSATTNISDVTSGGFSLNAGGDNVFAYDGTAAPSTGTSVAWVNALASNAFLTTGSASSSLTFLPSIFTGTNSFLSLGLANGAANENGAYTGGNVTGSADQIRTVLSNLTNWTTFTSAGAQPVPPNAIFTVQTSTNNPPTSLSLSNSNLFENEAVNAVVGSFTTADPNAGDTFTYSFATGTGSDDNASFALNGNVLQAASSFDFETKSSYTIRVRTTDQGGLFFEQAFTIDVLDVNEILNVRLNEIEVNPPSNASNKDKYQYVELLGTPNATLTNVSLVTFDGNGSSRGIANLVINLDGQTLGSNGLLVIKSPTSGHTIPTGTTVITDARFDAVGGALSKQTVSFFLATTSGPFNASTDYDGNNDGNLDGLPAGFALLDNVGWLDGDVGDVVYGGVSLSQSSGSPDAATRIVNNTTISTGAWFNGDLLASNNQPSDLLYDPTKSSSNLPTNPSGAAITPGATNFQESLSATASLRIVSYNIASSGGAPRTGLSTLLQAIGSEIVGSFSQKIDLLALQEVEMQSTTSAAIAAMLNGIYGAGIYATGTLNGASTGAGTQGVVYNTQTLQLLGEKAIGSASSTGQPRQTIRGHFETLAGGSSFQFYVYNGHWKSADDADSRNRRLVETQAIRADADSLGQGANIIYCGDFNLYTSTEVAYQYMLSAGNGQAFDPVARPGAWHGTSSFRDIFTQAPAVSPGAGLTGGGLDDRFDFQIISGELNDGVGLEYTTGSYHTFGNNGSVAVNGNLNDPSSTALPGVTNRQTILDLLTTVSDHLPVVADYHFPINVAPTDLNLSSNTITETAAADVVVGTLSSVDANASDTHTYTLVSGTGGTNNSSFTIVGNTLRSSSTFALDGTANYSVRVRTTDSGGLGFEKPITITVTNVAPTVTASLAAVNGNVLTTISNTGTYGDVASDTVSLSADIGTIVKNGNGTWSWSVVPSTAISNQTVTITASDEDGGTSNVTFKLNASVAVANAKVYYKGSALSATSVDNALDTGKSLAQSGSQPVTLSYNNLINWDRGINGLVFDVAGLASSSIVAADFGFRMSPLNASAAVTNQPSSWTDPVPAPTLIDVIAGTSTTPARVRLEWADNAIANRWLQIRILANAHTGLLSPVVYYIGHLRGDTNGIINASGFFQVRTDDITRIKLVFGQIVPASSNEDVTKDGKIRTADITATASFIGQQLSNITIPAAGSGAEGEASVPTLGPLQNVAPVPANPTEISFQEMVSIVSTDIPVIGPRWTGLDYSVPRPVDYIELGRGANTAEAESAVEVAGTKQIDSASTWGLVDDYFVDLEKRLGKQKTTVRRNAF